MDTYDVIEHAKGMAALVAAASICALLLLGAYGIVFGEDAVPLAPCSEVAK